MREKPANYDGWMGAKDAAKLKPGDKLYVLVDGFGDVEDKELQYDAGEVVTVFRLDNFGEPQGLAVTVVANNGVVNVFDKADYDGKYPFEPQEVAKNWGIRCPECGRDDEIDIAATKWVRLCVDSTDADASEDGNTEWDDQSRVVCNSCGYNSHLARFKFEEGHGA